MTTELAEKLYLAQYEFSWNGKPYAVFNPHDQPVYMLPVIYGFNNGGSPGWYSGCLIAEDGAGMGGHVCSHEGYMRHDLGVMEGSRPDRHETFKAHYPDGYRMDFVPMEDVRTHPGLEAAYQKNQELAKAAAAAQSPQGGGVMATIPRQCEHCRKLVYHYGFCSCPDAQLQAIDVEREALNERLLAMDARERDILGLRPSPQVTEEPQP